MERRSACNALAYPLTTHSLQPLSMISRRTLHAQSEPSRLNISILIVNLKSYICSIHSGNSFHTSQFLILCKSLHHFLKPLLSNLKSLNLTIENVCRNLHIKPRIGATEGPSLLDGANQNHDVGDYAGIHYGSRPLQL